MEWKLFSLKFKKSLDTWRPGSAGVMRAVGFWALAAVSKVPGVHFFKDLLA